MWTFQAPVADMLHLMDRVLDAPHRWAELPAFAGLDADTAGEVLAQAGRFAGEILAPINASGDLAGCEWSEQGVRTPAGYRQAYASFVEGGWPALACAPEAGGQGLPQLLNAALFEMLAAANHAWTMYPGLLHGAYEVVKAHGSPELREQGVSILLIEQNARAALDVADHGYVLETGAIVLAGPAADLAGDARVIDTYLGAARKAD